jgi:hypothetical protein
MKRVRFVLTSHPELGAPGCKAGVFLEALAVPSRRAFPRGCAGDGGAAFVRAALKLGAAVPITPCHLAGGTERA